MKINHQPKTYEFITDILKYYLLESGDIFQIKYKEDGINMYKGNIFEGSISNIYLRINTKNGYKFTKLLGIDSPSKFAIKGNQIFYKGEFESIKYHVIFTMKDNMWFYDVYLNGDNEEVLLFYGQDVSLNYHRANEAYICHYLDHKVFEDDLGYHILTKQNQGGPYLLEIGSLTPNKGYSTDGFQFFGLDYKFDFVPKAIKEGTLENKNYQYEFAYIALKSEVKFVNNQGHATFYGYFDHEYNDFPTKIEGLDKVKEVYQTINKENFDDLDFKRLERVININKIYNSRDLTNEELNKLFPKRYQEEIIDNKIVSFFLENGDHVVLKEKERHVERPHGNILINNGMKVISESPLATTNYIFGVFNSHVVVGHANIHKFSNDNKNPLNLVKLSGERILIKINDEYRLLGLPACYVLTPSSSSWYYKINDDMIKVEVATHYSLPYYKMEVSSLNNKEYDFICYEHLVLGENEYAHVINVKKEDNTLYFNSDASNFMHSKYPDLKYKAEYLNDKVEFKDDTIFFNNSTSQYPLLVTTYNNISNFSKVFYGLIDGIEVESEILNVKEMIENYQEKFEKNINYFKLENSHELVDKFNFIFKWFTHNALIHYASPHGLEQYGGGGWGTRDVLQGPLELFITLNRLDLARFIIKKLYARQFLQTGDWPQWGMFDKYIGIHAKDSHGDIILWPLHALSLYLEASNDIEILQEKVPYLDFEKGNITTLEEPIFDHVRRQVIAIKESFIKGTYLSRYGGGDWDDTLQPANKELTKKSVSGWTIALTIQSLEMFAKAISESYPKEAKEFKILAKKIKKDYYKYIVKDNVPAGFVYFTNPVQYMLHPLDNKTSIKYRLLPFNQGILGGIFKKKQALSYLDIIDENLKHPDGVRLMSTPVEYKGGKNTFFVRAETAANFGREIGLQYVHAHLRYCEAMSVLNKPERLIDGLLTVNPIKIQDTVKNALTRQSNLYFSSSDGCFYDRYEAKRNFDKLRQGEINVKGGWRLYSSGPGLYLSILLNNMLGVRRYHNDLVIDPCLDTRFNNTKLKYKFDDYMLNITYHVNGDKSNVKKVLINGELVKSKVKLHEYKEKAFVINRSLLKNVNEIEVYLE